MRCLIVGYGSIGARHARLLLAMGHEVRLVTSRRDVNLPVFAGIEEAQGSQEYDLVIVSSPTSRHAEDYDRVLRHIPTRRILLEKPAFAALSGLSLLPHPAGAAPDESGALCAVREAASTVEDPFERAQPGQADEPLRRVKVAYNLRFHPAVASVRRMLAGKELYSAVFHAGQYLPDWRPGTDYRAGYSADKHQGGGVLRDLSHELDLACHLTGTWRQLTAAGGRLSNLDISSDDTFSLLSSHTRCPHVAIHLNYLDRMKRRSFVIQHAEGTLSYDFVTGRLGNGTEEHTLACPPDETYTRQLQALLSGPDDDCCTLAQGLDVLRMIEAAEEAARRKIWIAK